MARPQFPGKNISIAWICIPKQGGGDGNGKTKKPAEKKPPKPKLTGLDATATAAKAPVAVDKSKFGLKIGNSDGKSGWQVMGYNGDSGNGTDALGNPYDPTKNTIYLTQEIMDAIDAAHNYGDIIPDLEDLTPEGLLDFLLGITQMDGANGTGSTAPNTQTSGNRPTKSNDDPKRFTRKGAVYYDANLHTNIRRDTDSTGEITDLPAKDTLPWSPPVH